MKNTSIFFLILTLFALNTFFALNLNAENITFKLSSQTGTEMPLKHVDVFNYETLDSVHSAGFSENTVEVNLEPEQYYYVRISAVNHKPEFFPLYVYKGEQPQIDVSLIKNIFDLHNGYYSILGNFNNFNYKSSVPLEEADDKYFFTVPPGFDTIRYMIVETSDKRPANGTDADYYEYAVRGDFFAVKVLNGANRIWFDAAQFESHPYNSLVRATTPSTDSYLKALYYTNDLKQRYNNLARVNKDLNNVANDLVQMLEEVGAKISEAKSMQVKNIYQLEYLTLASLLNRTDKKNVINKEIVEQTFADIPPDSWLWSRQAFIKDIALAGNMVINNLEDPKYVDAIITQTPDKDVKTFLTRSALFVSANMGNEKLMQKYLPMVKEINPDDPLARAVESKLGIFEELVDFKIFNLEDTTQVYTKADLKGNYVLLDFWATWCKPCIQSIPDLVAVHEKYKGKNFRILSISLDKDEKSPVNFRKSRYEMPWMHGIINSNFESNLEDDLDVKTIPRLFLINPEGKIVEYTDALRANLGAILAKYLDDPVKN